MDEGLTGPATSNVTSGVSPLIQIIDEIIDLHQKSLIVADLRKMKLRLESIANQFQDDQRSLPGTVLSSLRNLQDSLYNVKHFESAVNRKKLCIDRLLCKRRPGGAQNSEWAKLSNRIFDDIADLKRNISVFPNDEQERVLPLPQSDTEFVGSGIRSARVRLDKWLNAEHDQLPVIGIHGISGIGKTSLLKAVYNDYKKGNVFQAVIWITVSKRYNIMDLQSVIAHTINVRLESSSDVASSSDAGMQRKTKLSASLKEMKFLLILDDLQSPFGLQEELGIPTENKKGSKVVISARSIDVIQRMGSSDHIQMKRLSPEEGWHLFARVAFREGSSRRESTEDVAREIARECEGLPLAINVVASAMSCNASVIEWNVALLQMKNLDPVSLTNIDVDELVIYKQLKWCYDHLPDSTSKNCFLYCAAFPEDEEIDVQTVVEMWIGEALIKGKETDSSMDIGRRYVKLLVDRGLFEAVDKDMMSIKVHDVVRHIAIYIGEKEENCLFKTTQNLQEFPHEKEIEHCRRIGVSFCHTPFLPEDLSCPKLLTLIMRRSECLSQVPKRFLLNLTSLRVLDLSNSNIKSLPTSLGSLKALEFLKLSDTFIEHLPEGICLLSGLQFLHLDSCSELRELPSDITELVNLKHLNLDACSELTALPSDITKLENLKHLNIDACESLTRIPDGISGLKSLISLQMITGFHGALNLVDSKDGICTLEHLKKLPNLLQLSVLVNPGKEVRRIRLEDEEVQIVRSGIGLGIMGTWSKMRKLILKFNLIYLFSNKDKTVIEDLPSDIENMKNLQKFILVDYPGKELGNVCDLQQLEKLELNGCYQLEELPRLEVLPNLKLLSIIKCSKLKHWMIGSQERVGVVVFRQLESLYLEDLPILESVTNLSSSNGVGDEGTMPKLQVLSIIGCKLLKRLPLGVQRISKLKVGGDYTFFEGEGVEL